MEQQGLYLPEFERDNCGAGFICNLKGEKSHQIIHNALEILVKLEHRGAVSADGRTGDGAGILIDIPHKFFKRVCGFNLPESGEYAVGMVFLPRSYNQSNYCISIFEDEIKKQDLEILGWRDVPVDTSNLGKIASKTEPKIKQVFVKKNSKQLTDIQFNAKLYAARKIAEHNIIQSNISEKMLLFT
ncbi:MAG: hypothetical protein R2821_12090 [Flavobacteriaceae bacterium]